MYCQTVFSILSLLGVASARIVGVAAPSEIAPNSTFDITILTQNYIQTVMDVSAAYGVWQNELPQSLGNYIGSSYLGPDKSNILENITISAHYPDFYPVGSEANLAVAITSLYGASSGPVTTIFHVPFQITASTSNELVSTTNGTDSCSTPTPSTSSTASSSTVTSTPSPTLDAHELSVTIQGLENGMNVLIDNIMRDNHTTAQEQYTDFTSTVGRMPHLVAPGGTCPDPASGHQMTKEEAVQTIQKIQMTLNMVSEDVSDKDHVAGLTDSCAVSAAFFNSGLREYIFDNQNSGTGM